MHICMDNPLINMLRAGVACAQLKVPILDVEVGFHVQQSKGVDWVFVDHPSYLRPGGIYGDQDGVYGDNQVNAWQQCASSWPIFHCAFTWLKQIYVHPEGVACHSWPAAMSSCFECFNSEQPVN